MAKLACSILAWGSLCLCWPRTVWDLGLRLPVQNHLILCRQCSWDDCPQLCAPVPFARLLPGPGLSALFRTACLCSLMKGY